MIKILAGLVILAFGLASCSAPRATSAASPAPGPRGPRAATWNLPGGAPHLLAHYVDWFLTDAPLANKGAWDHWKYDEKGPPHNPLLRKPNDERDIASVYYPLIGTYSSMSRQVIRYHLKTARAAGIQGFIVDWYGKGDVTDAPIPLLLDEADKLGMKVAICYEEKLNFLWRGFTNRQQAIDNAIADLSYVVTHYAWHPAYLRRDGLPLIIQFDGWGQGKLGEQMFSPLELDHVTHSLPQPIAYCREGLVPAYHPAVPGAFEWWSASARQSRNFGETARRMVDEGKLVFFGNALSPGFDDTGVWGWGGGPRVTPREGLSLLRSSFDLAFTGEPEFIQIVTWNDFNEGTVVEPTRETGFQYLDAIATWWAQKFGGHADLNAIRQPFLEYARTCSPRERAELPPAPYTRYLEKRSLAVSVPNYLDVLDQKRRG